MALKQNEDFLRYLTMGAAGSAAVAHYLTDEEGHRMVELERYTMANKIWTTKIKRLRLPDLICVRCGLRVEARAKSNLEIRASDSNTPGREWNTSGLRASDLFAFVRWDTRTETVTSEPAFFSVAALEESVEFSKVGNRKAFSEGAEVDRVWTARVPKQDGSVVEVEERRVRTELATGRRQSYALPEGVPSHIYVKAGEAFKGGERFLLGVVAEQESLRCPGQIWNPASDLTSPDEGTRYTAIKVTGILQISDAIETLAEIAEHDPDGRIRLEAMGSLARMNPREWTRRLDEMAANREQDPSMAMEASFILSELGTPEAAEALLALAEDNSLDSEARSAAVWGLGTPGLSHAELILKFVADEDDDLALHALAAIGDLDEGLISEAKELLRGSDREAASAAALLSRQGRQGAAALLDAASWGSRASMWALVGLGRMPASQIEDAREGELAPEVAEKLELLQADNQLSWLRATSGDPLDFLERQTIRHKPPEVAEPQ